MVLDYSLVHWIAFLTAAILLNLSPGPDMAFILGHTVKSGIRTGFAALSASGRVRACMWRWRHSASRQSSRPQHSLSRR